MLVSTEMLPGMSMSANPPNLSTRMYRGQKIDFSIAGMCGGQNVDFSMEG
jgi:hypothetical protein